MLFDPVEANHFSPMRIDLYCFPSKLKRQPSRYQNFEAQSHSLFSRCLRLATTITGSHPRLATGGWLDLTRQAFHLLDYSPLSGRTVPICCHLHYTSSPIEKIAYFMKLVGWEQLAAQGVPRWQVHKRVAGGSQRRGSVASPV